MEARQSSLYFFDPKKVGEDLSEVALELISVEDQEIQSRWFHGQSDTDLFIWSDLNGRVIKQQISFYGQVVEWNFVDGVRTGYIVEDEVESQAINASETVHFDKEPQATTVEMAVQIIEHVYMDEVLKQSLLANFQETAKTTKKSFKKSKFASLLNRLKK